MQSFVFRAPAPAGCAPALPPAVLEFLNGLRHLPLGELAHAAGERAPALYGADRPAVPRSSPFEMAHARLRRVVASRAGLATQIQLQVTNLVEVVQGILADEVANGVRRHALAAALALATRPELGEETFAQLYAPFAALLPLPEAEPAASSAA